MADWPGGDPRVVTCRPQPTHPTANPPLPKCCHRQSHRSSNLPCLVPSLRVDRPRGDLSSRWEEIYRADGPSNIVQQL